MTDDQKIKDAWEDSGVTVGELREALALHSDDKALVFGPDGEGLALRFYRVKSRGDVVQIEFSGEGA